MTSDDKEQPIIRNAIITGTTLSIADHNLLTSYVKLRLSQAEYQGFGGYTLYRLRDEFDPAEDYAAEHGLRPVKFQIQGTAGHFISRVMQIAGVTEWSDLGGQAIRVKVRNGLLVAIGHIIEEDWFEPGIDFADVD